MTDIFLGPKRYVQRPGALADAGAELKAFGRRPMILADDLVDAILRPVLENTLPAAGLTPAPGADSAWSAAWARSSGWPAIGRAERGGRHRRGRAGARPSTRPGRSPGGSIFPW